MTKNDERRLWDVAEEAEDFAAYEREIAAYAARECWLLLAVALLLVLVLVLALG